MSGLCELKKQKKECVLCRADKEIMVEIQPGQLVCSSCLKQRYQVLIEKESLAIVSRSLQKQEKVQECVLCHVDKGNTVEVLPGQPICFTCFESRIQVLLARESLIITARNRQQRGIKNKTA